MDIFAFLTVFDDWYTVGTQCTNRQQQSKDSQNSKNDHWCTVQGCTNRHMFTQSPPNTQSHTWAFQRTHYWIPTIQDGWDTPFWKSTWRHFFLPRVVRFGYNFSDWYRMTCRLRWCVEMETRSRIPIWRTYVCVNSMACHPRATYHIAGCCHLVNSLARFQSHIPRCRVQSPDEINVVIMLHCRV